MGCLDHWNAAMLSKDLSRKPVGVRVAGRDLVLFRTASGKLGALDDACSHRRMRLSTGCVLGERIQCPYHAWTFDCQGAGESPGTPKLHAQTTAYDVREAFGVVWLKPIGSDASFPVFPKFEDDRYYHLGSFQHHAPAPLETTLDNFNEIEHTPTIHDLFGYELSRMAEVTTQVEATDATVRVINHGPSKRIAFIWRFLMGVPGEMDFHDDWTTFFSPVYSVFSHSWTAAGTERPAKICWKVFVFLTPKNDDETTVTSVVFTKSDYPGPYGGVRVVRPLLLHLIAREVAFDCRILNNLADKSPSLEGMKLSRFDRALWLNRERIERIYRGITPPPKLVDAAGG